MATKNQNLFSDFTNLYSLSKTLRFELKPVGKTQEMLEKNKVFEKDKLLDKKYQDVKPYFDRLHREFVVNALKNVSLDNLDRYFNVFKEFRKDPKDKDNRKSLENEEQRLRELIVCFFNRQAEQYASAHSFLKNKDVEIFFEEGVFELLKEKFSEEKNTKIINKIIGKEESIFDGFNKFTGYFTKFHETRRNFYKSDGTSSALATRIIDQNLKRFCDNLLAFEQTITVKNIDFAEIEKNFSISLADFFIADYYNSCLLQDGIDKYNKIIGGETLKSGEKLKGINEIINKYRQDNKSEKIPFLKTLDKQILSEKVNEVNEVNKDNILSILDDFQKDAEERISKLKILIENFTQQKEDFDLAKVYLTKEALNTISRRWTGETGRFEEALYKQLKKNRVEGLKEDKNEGTYKFPDFIALLHIKSALEENFLSEKLWKDRYYKTEENKEGIFTQDISAWNQFLQILRHEFLTNFKLFDKSSIVMNQYLKIALKNIFENNEETKAIIKEFADSILLKVYSMASYFALEKKRQWDENIVRDSSFYDNSEYGFLRFYENSYEAIVKKYNSLRNFLTKKPWEEVGKRKLNFENSTLGGGWDKNKEKDNYCVLFRKGEKYFLGIMKKGYHDIFEDKNLAKTQEDILKGKHEKMVYKFFPDQAKMFPKVCFSQKGRGFFSPSDEILRIYENEEFKIKTEGFSLESMQKIINFYKTCLKTYEGWQCYDFKNLKETSEYRDNIGEFFTDVARDGYKISFIDISDKYIQEKNQNGEFYLFEIYNQDFAKEKTGKKNLHTIYFENLFSFENQKEFPLKLNGGAEIFFRPKVINAVDEKRNFSRKITNKKRYTEDKIFFHLPITLNRSAGNDFGFNLKINNFLANNPDINIIGVDRGEKHLAYYSVINQKGDILENGSLNFIQSTKENGELILKNGKKIEEVRNSEGEIIDYKIIETGEKVKAEDYKLLLEYKEKKRKIERQTWQTVEGIKDLKKGYISQVIRKLADLVVNYNAIIIFEDLNMRFKQIRGGIEKSAYQQLEKALIEKLNFLVDKSETNAEKAGNALKAYQLTAPFTTFKEMEKQTGIIFYTQASYTSKIDPVTGWRPNLYLKYANAKQIKSDILNFSKITYSFSKNRFGFTYDLKNFGESKNGFPQKTEWTLYSCVERFRWDKQLNQNKGAYKHYPNLTENFQELFKEHNIKIEDSNILGQIETLETKQHEKFFKDFIFLWQLLCQIRNTDESKKDNENDFILSPVEPFFDSRNAGKFGKNLPQNGDENGAYNIARKGIIILNKISTFSKNNGDCKKLKWGDLAISHIEWDNAVSDWDKYILETPR